MAIFRRTQADANVESAERKDEADTSPKAHHNRFLPSYYHNKIAKGIHPDGESGRRWFSPWHFTKICLRSTSKISAAVNVLWPFVPPAIAIHFARPDLHLWIFILNYIAMVPTANLVGFAGQELARKIPKVIGLILELTLASVVEIILFMVLLRKDQIVVIQAAILGSILANLLLCLGACFFASGIRRETTHFDEQVSEAGSGLLLVAGLGLMVPSAFFTALKGVLASDVLQSRVLTISRVTSVCLLIAYLIFVWFQLRTHHSIFDQILARDEENDADRHKDLAKAKLTLTECIIALVLALACVSLHAVFLVEQISFIVEERHVSDPFVGLILVPLVEKAAEHLTALDEAWDNQMNFALSHILGSAIQTALLVAPITVIVGWGLHKPMDLNFEIFMIVILILAIIVVGNFLRDSKTNYLEGALCVIVYIIVAISAWFYPNPHQGATNTAAVAPEGGGHR
ncbi:hypothetical protein GP486_004810 [Trichoglossum hirsutum]|uniref:Vacuolar calcium ion transporter n=1 Tax=Trichoglossum hirsutum TaxID=265104 RepID=A0A9P8LAB2_9PEZI|nr:hypothetical protein GP486_004810 [Trichoglossum hirsutum]